MHRQYLALLCFGVAFFALAPLPSNGQRRDNEWRNRKIEKGTLINDARTILESAKVPPGGARAFAAHPSGDQWVLYALRDEKVDLVIRYSPRTSKVTELSLYYVADRRSKGTDIAIEASAIQFTRMVRTRSCFHHHGETHLDQRLRKDASATSYHGDHSGMAPAV